MLPKFNEINIATPDLDELSKEYASLRNALADPKSKPRSAIEQWDKIRREVATWQNLAELNFERDTNDESAIAVKQHCDEMSPQLTELDISIKQLILDGPHRDKLQEALGEQAFAIWRSEVLAFNPDIKNELVAESKLASDFSSLLASAKLDFRGKEYNHEGIDQFKFSPDRAERYESMSVKWKWFEENADQLDELFERLVQTRQKMAQSLDFENYLELGYLRRCRVDYTKEDVEAYRNQVRDSVVPFCEELIASKGKSLNLDKAMFWDEPIHSLGGNPKPLGEHDWMIEQAKRLFSNMSNELGEFFHLMVDLQLLDLKTRSGKGGGGFCTDFPKYGLPYIFANFNGSADDVRVFTHEIGHAFQGFKSREQKIYDYVWPTYESCEIHSMGLEFLTFPQMDNFFGEQANQFCHEHVIDSLLFLPYGVAVDHFQHLVYESPAASARDRHEMWLEMEARYLPWRDYGDLPYLPNGGRWQLQRHIYMYPLYYIDYTLALACALQLWQRSSVDFSATLVDYHRLCELGGTLPFQQLIETVNLKSPFGSAVLGECVAFAKSYLMD